MQICFHALMPELVKMYNSGNSAADISKIVYFGGCSEYESRKSAESPAVISYNTCLNVFKEAEVHYMYHNLPFCYQVLTI